MKGEEQTRVKTFDSVEYFRKVKERIAKELRGKSFEEQKQIIQRMLDGEIKVELKE